jgi:hypothetical protein
MLRFVGANWAPTALRHTSSAHGMAAAPCELSSRRDEMFIARDVLSNDARRYKHSAPPAGVMIPFLLKQILF